LNRSSKNISKQHKEYQDSTNKKLEKTPEQLNSLREDFNKLQNENKEIMKG
jgi:predicted translin family RNA/ssDNA-binding protein